MPVAIRFIFDPHISPSNCQTSRTGFWPDLPCASSSFAFPFFFRDTAYYEELARNCCTTRLRLLLPRALLPSDARAPGYPAFSPGIYFLLVPAKAVMLAQAFVDLATVFAAASRSSAGLPADPHRVARLRFADSSLSLHRQLHHCAATI